jgi:hypothetical protein
LANLSGIFMPAPAAIDFSCSFAFPWSLIMVSANSFTSSRFAFSVASSLDCTSKRPPLAALFTNCWAALSAFFEPCAINGVASGKAALAAVAAVTLLRQQGTQGTGNNSGSACHEASASALQTIGGGPGFDIGFRRWETKGCSTIFNPERASAA